MRTAARGVESGFKRVASTQAARAPGRAAARRRGEEVRRGHVHELPRDPGPARPRHGRGRRAAGDLRLPQEHHQLPARAGGRRLRHRRGGRPRRQLAAARRPARRCCPPRPGRASSRQSSEAARRTKGGPRAPFLSSFVYSLFTPPRGAASPAPGARSKLATWLQHDDVSSGSSSSPSLLAARLLPPAGSRGGHAVHHRRRRPRRRRRGRGRDRRPRGGHHRADRLAGLRHHPEPLRRLQLDREEGADHRAARPLDPRRAAGPGAGQPARGEGQRRAGTLDRRGHAPEVRARQGAGGAEAVCPRPTSRRPRPTSTGRSPSSRPARRRRARPSANVNQAKVDLSHTDHRHPDRRGRDLAQRRRRPDGGRVLPGARCSS